MDELKEIYRNLQDIYLHYNSLQCVLSKAEILDQVNEKADTALFLHFSAYYINAVQNELRRTIGRMDKYLLLSSRKG